MIDQPFVNDQISFTYRIGEVLRRCLEVDALGHLLSVRWLVELFRSHGLIGAHPGVEFVRNNETVAEVDVLLLFENGAMIPVEVKRPARGFDSDAATQLDAGSELLHADFDFVAVMEPRALCAEVEQFQRRIPEKPRFLLTFDHLSEANPTWSVGRDPFESTPHDDHPEDGRRVWIRDLLADSRHPADLVANNVAEWKEQ